MGSLMASFRESNLLQAVHMHKEVLLAPRGGKTDLKNKQTYSLAQPEPFANTVNSLSNVVPMTTWAKQHFGTNHTSPQLVPGLMYIRCLPNALKNPAWDLPLVLERLGVQPLPLQAIPRGVQVQDIYAAAT